MLPKQSWLVFLALAAASSLSAAEITGKVRDASGDTATVVIDGDALPAVGDGAEIFFKIPGADEEISVASGKVAAVDAKVVTIKIEKTGGTLEKDQLARIKSGSTGKPPAASPSSASSPSTTGSSNPIRGDWTITEPDGTKVSFSFKEDGSLLWVVEGKGFAGSTRAKYRVDTTVTPQVVEFFDFEEGEFKGQVLLWVFEVQNDGRLKLAHPEGGKRGGGFTAGALIFSRPKSPVVPAPSKKSADIAPSTIPTAPGASVSPASSPSGTVVTSSSITGDWTSTFPDGTVISFRFKEDGTLLWVVEDAKYAQSTRAKYRIDRSTQPGGLVFFDIEEGEVKGEKLRGIFEVQVDGRLKIDFARGPEVPPLKEFSDKMLVFSKATSPVARPNKPAPPTPTPSQATAPSVAFTPSPDKALVEEARQRYDRGDEAGAMEALEKAIALNPKNASAYLWRGMWIRTKDAPAAIADFEKAMELDPSLKLKELIDSEKAALKEKERAKPRPTRARPKPKSKA